MNSRRWGSFYEGQKLKAWSSDVFQNLRHTVWPIQNGPHNKTNSFDNEINMSNSCVQSDWSVTSFNIFTINICLELDMLTNRETKSMTRWEIEPKDFCIVTFSSHFTKFQLYSLKEKCFGFWFANQSEITIYLEGFIENLHTSILIGDIIFLRTTTKQSHYLSALISLESYKRILNK